MLGIKFSANRVPIRNLLPFVHLSESTYHKNYTIGGFPLLNPNNSTRSGNWFRTLNWYGYNNSTQRGHLDKSKIDQRGVVVCFKDEFLPLAQLYANITSRPVIEVNDFSDITFKQLITDFESLLIIGTPKNLSNEFLQKVSRLNTEWGFLTAIDLPGLSFCLVKQLLAINQKKTGLGIYDALELSKTEVDKSGRYLKPDSLNNNRIVDDLQRNKWNTLLLHCHGDGAHARFGSGVLCGLTLDRELNLKNVPIGNGSCQKGASGYECKRGGSKEKKIVVFGTLQATNVILLTCNGVSVAGNIYPSNSSFLLSAAEGIPATVLSTDRRIIFEEDIFKLITSLLREGVRLSVISKILNDVHERKMNCRPYLLFGDPFLRAFDPSKLSLLKKQPDKPDISCISSSRNKLLRTKTHLYLLSSRPNSKNMIEDKTNKLFKLRKVLKLIESRINRIDKLIAAVQTINLVNDTEAQHLGILINSIQSMQSFLNKILAIGFRMHLDISSSGVWDAGLEDWYKAINSGFESIDDLLVELIDLYLLDGEVEIPICDGAAFIKIADVDKCPRCNCVMQLETGFNLANEPLYNCIKCPTCGPLEAWEEGFPRVSISLSDFTVHRKSNIYASINSESKNNPLNEICSISKLIYQLRDTGHARICFQGRSKSFKKEKKLKLYFTNENSYEMHTIRVMSIQAGTFAYARQRIACIS